ncbi:hypothetical protein F5Y08DRAFT_353394 [Xylaria arbuscula]|nr:hypothetical protein F5Y08DRAFT_353394 [Xylaria arbuscula]
MTDAVLNSESLPRPKLLDHYDPDGDYPSLFMRFAYHGVQFDVLVSSDPNLLPRGYDFNQSIEGKILREYDDLTYGTPRDEKDDRMDALANQLGELASDACFPMMQEIAPCSPLPEPRTLAEQLYPPGHTLQMTRDGETLGSRTIDYEHKEEYPPLTEEQLRKVSLNPNAPVYHASEVVLIERLQSLVFKVEIEQKTMICKVSSHPIFGATLAKELGVYQKLGQQRDDLKIPQFKGVVKSHKGIIAILLGYIPHKHHSLGTTLRDIKEGHLPKSEATTAMRAKWEDQITSSVTQLHKLGILWHDVKTDNVLIDDKGDAIILDFGGGNTVGWADKDKWGTVEGDSQALEKIREALRED